MAQEIELDVDGTMVRAPRDLVNLLAASAAARAGISSRHRDLSLLLVDALRSGQAKLGRGEVRALSAVLEEERHLLGSDGADLLRAVA